MQYDEAKCSKMQSSQMYYNVYSEFLPLADSPLISDDLDITGPEGVEEVYQLLLGYLGVMCQKIKGFWQSMPGHFIISVLVSILAVKNKKVGTK